MRLLLFDLDGTLLTSEKTVSPGSLDAVGKARKAGYLAGIVTSRSVRNSESFLASLSPDLLIASGGAIALYQGSVLFRHGFSGEETGKIIRKAREIVGPDAEITVDVDFAHFTNFRDKYDQSKTTWGEDIYTAFDDWRDESLKVCVRIPEEEKARELIGLLPHCDAIRFSEEYWYKFTKAGVTKEDAVREACSLLSVSLSDVTAFGDDLADIGMLRMAGVGVAMGNALDEVKKAADRVIGGNDGEGIRDYLEALLKEEA